MPIKLEKWNLPSIFFVWSRFQWHSPGFTGSEGGVGVIRPNFSLVHQNLLGRRGTWGLEGAWKLNVGLVQTYHIDGGNLQI